MQLANNSPPSYKNFLSLDEFLLVNDYAKQAFINLSKTKEAICRHDLLEETKRMIIEHFMEQLRKRNP